MSTKKQQKQHFNIEITADQSPSLRLYLEDGPAEALKKELMHSSAGAASETIQIYGKAIDHALKYLLPTDLNFLVVGLGLGYIESLIALKTQGLAQKVLSFEINKQLRQNFNNWRKDIFLNETSQPQNTKDSKLHSLSAIPEHSKKSAIHKSDFLSVDASDGAVYDTGFLSVHDVDHESVYNTNFLSVYDRMWSSLKQKLGLKSGKECLTQLNLKLLGDLTDFISQADNQSPVENNREKNPCHDYSQTDHGRKNLEDLHATDKFHVICYDAFSGHTDSHLWSYDFLLQFLNHSAHQDCVFTTYAATSALKKALKDSGFTIHKQKGFAGKRESTFATKGLFSS